MYNVKERLRLARERILYMPRTVYQFADYLAKKLYDNADPGATVAAIHSALRDIRNVSISNPAYPALFAEDREQALADARFVLQVIDAVMDKNFAEAVRSLCRKQLGWNPFKWVKTLDRAKLRKNYEPHIVAATEWWATAILLADRADLSEDPQYHYEGRRECSNFSFILDGFTRDEMEHFRSDLAEHLSWDLKKRSDNGAITISTSPELDIALQSAADYTCVYDEIMEYVFPKNTTMYISAKKIEVYGAYGTEYIRVWEAEPEE